MFHVEHSLTDPDAGIGWDWLKTPFIEFLMKGG
jgi:hypothetical protein